jgi:membrane fusion protein, copper/silver efflux system
MKTAFLSVVLLGMLGASFVAGGWHHQRKAVGTAALHGRRILYYVDPMHPAYTSERPGIAPDCGMALEPVYADGRSDDSGRALPAPDSPAGTVSVSAARQQLIGVRMVAVDKTAATERLRAYGRVAADETGSYRIDIGIDGFIRELSSVTTGTRVRKDQWLATFSAPDVRSPIQAFLVGLEPRGPHGLAIRRTCGNRGRPHPRRTARCVGSLAPRIGIPHAAPTGAPRIGPVIVAIVRPAG